MLNAFGVDTKSEDPDVQALVKNAPVVGSVLAKGAVDLMFTTMPQLIPTIMEQVFPGLSQMYERVAYAEEWDAVRNTAGNDGKPTYGDLPDYGSKEFQTAIRQAATQIPGFDGMVFRDKTTGRVLPFREQTRARYAVLAKLMTGQRVNPAVVQEAVETGKQLERKVGEKRRAGQALGAGQSKGQFAQPESDVNASIIAAYNARNGNVFSGR